MKVNLVPAGSPSPLKSACTHCIGAFCVSQNARFPACIVSQAINSLLFHKSIAQFRMKKSAFNQGVSIKVFIHDHVRQDRTSTIYLRVTIDRRKREFNLQTSWPKQYFDKIKQEAKPRHMRDKELEAINMIIDEAKGRATKIKLRHFSDGKMLTLDTFQEEFENYESRDNFIYFWQTKQQVRFDKNIITRATLVRNNSNLKRIKLFLNGENILPMSSITGDLLEQFKYWLKHKKKLQHNTVVNVIKNFKTYISLARDDGHKIGLVKEKTKMRYQPGERPALTVEEVQQLYLLLTTDLDPTEREVLRKFLFSCLTGLRISDNAKITSGMVRNGCLIVPMVKGEGFGKVVTIPLGPAAKELISGKTGLLFEPLSDQVCNRWLKLLSVRAGIKKRLTFHVSRDTFATLSIEGGASAFTLKELMGHSSIQTTQLYVKMTDKSKVDLVMNLDKLINTPLTKVGG